MIPLTHNNVSKETSALGIYAYDIKEGIVITILSEVVIVKPAFNYKIIQLSMICKKIIIKFFLNMDFNIKHIYLIFYFFEILLLSYYLEKCNRLLNWH